MNFNKSTLIPAQGFYLNHWGLHEFETQRLHISKAGNVGVRPYPMTVSYSVRGLALVVASATQPVIVQQAGQGIINLLKRAS